MVLTTKGKLTIALIVVVVIASIVWLVYTLTQPSADAGNVENTTAMVNTMVNTLQITGWTIG